MDDYGPESIIRADPNGSAASIDDDGDSPSGSQLNGALANLRLGHSRVVSVAGSVLNAPRQENVLVCVRVRPPAVGPAMLSSGYVNPAHLEEAWIADSETGLITLADETKQVSDYHFGEYSLPQTNITPRLPTHFPIRCCCDGFRQQKRL